MLSRQVFLRNAALKIESLALMLLVHPAELMMLLGALWLALGIDRLWGEPPRWLHPVVAMGRYFTLCSALLLRQQAARAFILGALAWCLGALAVGALAWGLQTWVLSQLSPLLALLALACLLKPLMAWRMLRDEVQAVEQATGQSLQAARDRLAWLVSRDVTALSETEVRETAMESLAENLNDSVIAPLFWFLLLGLPGAAVYRFANTADAMWAYRGRWEWAGKWAAHADDALSFLPARLTALLIWAVNRRFSLTELHTHARQTPSPNSGWPMAAMALALGVVLRKPAVYVLNPGGRTVLPVDLADALKTSEKTLICFTLIGSVALVFEYFRQSSFSLAGTVWSAA